MLTFFLGSSWRLTVALDLYPPGFKSVRKERMLVTQGKFWAWFSLTQWHYGTILHWPLHPGHEKPWWALPESHTQSPSTKHIDLSGDRMDSWGNQEKMNDRWSVKQRNFTLLPYPRSLPWKCLAVFSVPAPVGIEESWDYRLRHGNQPCLRPSPTETHDAVPFLKSLKCKPFWNILSFFPFPFLPDLGFFPSQAGCCQAVALVFEEPVLWASQCLLQVLIPSINQ